MGEGILHGEDRSGFPGIIWEWLEIKFKKKSFFTEIKEQHQNLKWTEDVTYALV